MNPKETLLRIASFLKKAQFRRELVLRPIYVANPKTKGVNIAPLIASYFNYVFYFLQNQDRPTVRLEQLAANPEMQNGGVTLGSNNTVLSGERIRVTINRNMASSILRYVLPKKAKEDPDLKGYSEEAIKAKAEEIAETNADEVLELIYDMAENAFVENIRNGNLNLGTLEDEIEDALAKEYLSDLKEDIEEESEEGMTEEVAEETVEQIEEIF